MAAVNSLVQVNYYRDIQASGTATTWGPLKFFDGHDHADNDLRDGGILPDNRRGQITGIFARALQPFQHATVETSAMCLETARAITNVIETSWLTVYVNNNEHTRLPMFACAHPPIWHSNFIQAQSTDSSYQLTQNGGYMLFFQNIEVESRQRIRIEVETTRAAARAPGETIEIEVVIQVLDEKAA